MLIEIRQFKFQSEEEIAAFMKTVYKCEEPSAYVTEQFQSGWSYSMYEVSDWQQTRVTSGFD